MYITGLKNSGGSFSTVVLNWGQYGPSKGPDFSVIMQHNSRPQKHFNILHSSVYRKKQNRNF